ncbi:corA-like mg2+ transporter protein domain-containing protein [Trichoderma breve]|uniref:CorA-like mg2+ transporter protein domain-containing protein n=1 Tax=Trichoderma breve TaxID=2034170 RepID=A0A9W9EDJ7_9HYPO|nr:corA-like mg2+ transporter protein domain-containing protein [Trichoderma breve]KAJ4864729.1 corA-like mg2+ transporter protein domain-containing protein [Trichoderma breve]
MGRRKAPCYCPKLETVSWRDCSGEKVVTTEKLTTQDLLKSKETEFAVADVTITTAFEQKFQIPRVWWTTLARRSNGYFGHQDVLDSDGTRTGTISWVRFMVKRVSKILDARDDETLTYHWVKLNAVTRWYASNNRTDIVLFDHPQFALQNRETILRNINPRELGDPFWVYPSMVEEIAQLHDVTIWETRNLLRDFELRRAFYRFSYMYLHEIPRHMTHVNEMVYVTESILTSIQKHHNQFLATDKVDTPKLFFLNIQNRLDSLHNLVTNLRHRAESNNTRIQNEMALTYSDAARIDSSAMRAISLVGLLFLPAAFVAAIFSTSFFNFDAPTGIWKLSSHFWLYWVVVVPLTAVTIVSWFFGARIMDRIMPQWRRWIE